MKENTYSSQYLYYSIEFYSAAHAEYWRMEIDSLPVLSNLFHSIELILKGYLKYKLRINDDELRTKYSHRILDLYQESLNNDLKDYVECTQADLENIKLLAELVNGKKLYYPSKHGNLATPHADDLIPLTKKLIIGLVDLLRLDGPIEQVQNLEKGLSRLNLTFEEIFFNSEHGRYKVTEGGNEE